MSTADVASGRGTGTGPITLVVPSNAAMARVARLTASTLASLADLDVDLIDDVKIVVSEIVAALIERGEGEPVTLQFELGDGSITVEGTTCSTSFDINDPEISLCAMVLGAVSAEHRISFDGSTASIWAITRSASAV